jgi:hypothetical protein
MGQMKGDKARYHRQRRKKIARRETMRALRATLGATKAGTETKIQSAVSPAPRRAAGRSGSRDQA